MRPPHPSDGRHPLSVTHTLERSTRLAPPTISGMVTAGATVVLLVAVSLVLLIPSVFYLMPIPRGADALTLCLPGVGPLQRFQEPLHPTQEELTFVHEAAHAEQCRSLGAVRYARQAVTAEGRLRLETQALCAESAVLARRGADGERLRAWAIETLRDEYFDDESVTEHEISAAVDVSCGITMAE